MGDGAALVTFLMQIFSNIPPKTYFKKVFGRVSPVVDKKQKSYLGQLVSLVILKYILVFAKNNLDKTVKYYFTKNKINQHNNQNVSTKTT